MPIGYADPPGSTTLDAAPRHCAGEASPIGNMDAGCQLTAPMIEAAQRINKPVTSNTGRDMAGLPQELWMNEHGFE
jgi:hypothetical protein